jgi:hypothetical protein
MTYFQASYQEIEISHDFHNYSEDLVFKLRNALVQSFFVSGALLSNCHRWRSLP